MHEPFRDLGLQRVKNITRPIRIWQWSPDADYENAGEVAETSLSQSVQFCSSADGTLLAYAKIGAGAPVLKAPNWLGHLEYEWQSPVWEPWIRELARNYELTRFDQRGSGLSDWDVAEISEDAMQADMRAVADAAGLERFALIGISQGCPFSIRYAAENPDRVKCLVLLGGFAAGRLQTGTKDDESVYQASLMMIEQGWGSPNPAYRHFFTSSLIADASPEEAKSFDELQRLSSSPQNAMRITEMNAKVDVRDLARQIKVPTLVLHTRGDRRVQVEHGRRMAALIPGARFVMLEGNNHILLKDGEGFDEFFAAVHPFLKEHG